MQKSHDSLARLRCVVREGEKREVHSTEVVKRVEIAGLGGTFV